MYVKSINLYHMRKIIVLLLFFAIATVANATNRDGHFWLQLRDRNIPIDDASRYFGQWLSLPADATFALLKDETDELGIRHLRYRQYVAGVEVQASMIIVHGRDGLVTSANGVVMEQKEQPRQMRRAQNVDNEQQKMYLVKGADGYRYARLQYDFMNNADVYVDIETGETVKLLPRRHSLEETMQGRSVYSGTVPLTVNTMADGMHWLTDSTRNIYTLNAIHAKENQTYSTGKSEGGTTIYDRIGYLNEECKPFHTADDFWMMRQVARVTLDNVEKQSDPFAEVYMVIRNRQGDMLGQSPTVYCSSLPATIPLNTKGGMSAFCNVDSFYIETYLYQYTGDDTLLESVGIAPLAEGQHTWTGDHTSGRIDVELVGNPVVDIHWGMAQTYDWYKSTFGRDSYDGKGSPIYNIFFVPVQNSFISMIDGNNALAEYDKKFNCYVMLYGYGDGVTMRPVVALDVMAHEYTHLVTASTARLENRAESGALNESFSDIMGICVKHAVKGSKVADNWMIGDEATLQKSCIRDMSHRQSDLPKVPIIYKGDDWLDDADEHVNCAVQNYWFYLLCNGGIFPEAINSWGATGISISAIGMKKAVQIAYRNLTQYLTETSQYPDAWRGSLQAVADLYGEGSPEYDAVYDAWSICGMTDNLPDTAIHPVLRTSGADSRQWYNLQGQRIDAPNRPGIYIRNGKKIVIKK